MSSHPTVELTAPDGHTVPVDEEISPLISALWEHGIQTGSCCQETAPGYASVTFHSLADFLAFLEEVVDEPDDDGYDRLDAVDSDEVPTLPYHLRAAGWLFYAPSTFVEPWPGEWRYALNPTPVEGGGFDAIVTVDFPTTDVDAITERLVGRLDARV